MEYQQALIIGRRRRSDAALALSIYVQERATDICAVKPAKGQGMDAKEWEPVGEQSFKEICIRTSPPIPEPAPNQEENDKILRGRLLFRQCLPTSPEKDSGKESQLLYVKPGEVHP